MTDIQILVIHLFAVLIVLITWIAWGFLLVFLLHMFLESLYPKYEESFIGEFIGGASFILIGLLTIYRYNEKETDGIVGFVLDILYLVPELIEQLLSVFIKHINNF
jgi:hypothetical protein